MVELKIITDTWELNKNFNISRGSKTLIQTLEVQISKDENTGVGEGVPYAHYNESIKSVTKQIEEIRTEIESNTINLNNLSNYISAGSARNAVDCALWDLECKKNNQSIWSLLNISKPSIVPCSYTIVLDSVDRMVADADDHKEYPILKIKVDENNLEEIITKIRMLVPQSKLIIDANEAFNIDTLKANMNIFEKTSIDLIEQPLPSKMDNQLVDFKSPVPICADESFHTMQDLKNISKKYDAVNVKLDKTGGLSEALLIVKEARKNKQIIMIGCMVATSLSMFPALTLHEYADFIDLDGSYFLKNDRPNGIQFKNGKIELNNQSCWG